MENFVQTLTLSLLPPKTKRGTNGWVSCNCPACIVMGHPRPDTRFRGGFQFERGGARYNCFNCSFTASWRPGLRLNKNFKKLLKLFGASDQDIIKANYESFQIRETLLSDGSVNYSDIVSAGFNRVNLPDNSQPLIQAIESGDERAAVCAQYLYDRGGENLLKWYDDFYWSPVYPDRVIFPFRQYGDIYGWTARKIDDKSKAIKYLTSKNNKFVFGADNLFHPNRNYVIVSEGPFDAIAGLGVATMGNIPTVDQINMINSTDKEIIVFADRDGGGAKMLELAQKYGWSASFPPFGKKIKDVWDATQEYGRAAALKMIIDNRESNPLKIDINKRAWCRL